jgi:hypothetical protein
MEKYKATIHNERIEWESEIPADVKNGDRVEVEITLAQKPLTQSVADRRRALAALKAIADRGGIRSIPDPVAWQREVRKERPLPGRD